MGEHAAVYLPLPGASIVGAGPGERLWIDAPAGTPVHAPVDAEVAALQRADDGTRVVELAGDDGIRYHLRPLGRCFVRAGGVVRAGHVVGTLADADPPGLELRMADGEGRWLDPYPRLVGLADPNELGMEAVTSTPVVPDLPAPPEPARGDERPDPGSAPASPHP